MRFNRLKSKLKNFYAIFIAPPMQWRLPKKSEILIYDACEAEVLMPYLTVYSVEIIPLRGESVNILCLLRALLKSSFWRGKPIQAYVDAFIEAVSPKVVITFIDNNCSFYGISKRFPDIKTIFLQNGIRGELADIFGCLVKSGSYHVDYMLVFGSSVGRKYKTYISGSVLAIGSLKNNTVKKSLDAIDGSVLFISQYRDKPKNNAPFIVGVDGTSISFDQFYSADMMAIKFLSRWCTENKMRLKICAMSSEKTGPENQFYADILNGCVWEYIPRSDQYSSYKLVDTAQIVVFIDSTLGYESIGRGKKTASFSCREVSLNSAATRFGWPADIPNNGPFWTNDQDEKQFQRVMDYLNTVSDVDWEQTRQRYVNELMEFDVGNTHFIALLNQLMPKCRHAD